METNNDKTVAIYAIDDDFSAKNVIELKDEVSYDSDVA